MRIFLIRHCYGMNNGQSRRWRMRPQTYNFLQRISRVLPLTGNGVRQAARAARRETIHPAPRLYASPYLRAWMTAAIFGWMWRRWPRILPDSYEVRKAPVSPKQPPAPYTAFMLQSFARMTRQGIPGESWYHSIRRAQRLWRKLETDLAEHEIALVTHGQLIRLLLALALINPRRRIRQVSFEHGGVSVIDVR